MDRRELLGGLFGSFVAAAGMSPSLRVETAPEPGSKDPLNLENFRFAVVAGATMANQFQYPNIRRAPGGVDRSDYSGSPPAGVAVFEVVTETSGNPQMWPRASKFQVMHQVQVGTIEQHVELFRQQLTQAARTYFCGDNPETAPRIPTFPGRDEALALQSELEQLETDPTVATVICFGHKRELCEAYDEQLARRGVERAET